MKLKNLPFDILLKLYPLLDTRDWLSLFATESAWLTLLDYPPLWHKKATQMGIASQKLDTLTTQQVKTLIVHRMRQIYQQVRQICSAHTAVSLSTVLIEDNAPMLERHLRLGAKASATALLPLAMQYRAVHVMDSLFHTYQVPGRYQWLLMAIRYEHYAAVVYLIDVLKVPLVTDDRAALLPATQRLWNPHYQQYGPSGRTNAGTFCRYNELILREAIRTRHPKILVYLQQKIMDQVDQLADAYPYTELLVTLKRHSLSNVRKPEAECVTPDMLRLRK